MALCDDRKYPLSMHQLWDKFDAGSNLVISYERHLIGQYRMDNQFPDLYREG